MSSTPIIITEDLTRAFKDNIAVNKLSLEIQQGDLFGLIGPDGAGKTTTLRLLAGLLDITEGSAQVAGYDLATQHEMIKSTIGYMAQEFSLYADLSVSENLSFFAELYNVPRDKIGSRMEDLLQFANLTDFKNRRARHLSGGMQKKLALSCTLIHQPKILLLDEPTTGVDPVSRREFWNILTNLHLEGTTILVSTPYMDEADRCSQIGLMYRGELIDFDTPENIRNNLEGEIIELRTDDWKKAIEIVSKLPGVNEVQTYGDSLHILVDDASKQIKKIQRAVSKKKISIRSISETPPRMEEAFISRIRKLEE